MDRRKGLLKESASVSDYDGTMHFKPCVENQCCDVVAYKPGCACVLVCGWAL